MARSSSCDGDGLTDEGMDRQPRALGAEVARAARQLADAGACDYDNRPPTLDRTG